MSKETGGTAFPELTRSFEDRRDGGTFYESSGGMTLRDYFAANSPIGVAEANATFFCQNGCNASTSEMLTMLAALRGAYADSMIAERAK